MSEASGGSRVGVCPECGSTNAHHQPDSMGLKLSCTDCGATEVSPGAYR